MSAVVPVGDDGGGGAPPAEEDPRLELRKEGDLRAPEMTHEEAMIRKFCTFSMVRTLITACVLACVVSLTGGIYMYSRSLQSLQDSVQDASFTDTLRIAEKLLTSVRDCNVAVANLQTFFVDNDKQIMSGANAYAETREWDHKIRWYEYATVSNSPTVQEAGIILLPHTVDDPDYFYSHVWIDFPQHGEEYVHARYGLFLSDVPADPALRDNDSWGAPSPPMGYHTSRPVSDAAKAWGFKDGTATDANQTDADWPKLHIARVNLLNSTTGESLFYAYNASGITSFHSMVPNTTLPLSQWPADFRPAGWQRGPDPGMIMSRWRTPQVWYASDFTPYVFTAFDVVRAPPPPPHPWSRYRAVLTQAYFVFRTWNQIISDFKQESQGGASGTGYPDLLLYDVRTNQVYGTTTGVPLVNINRDQLGSAIRTGDNPDLDDHIVRVANLTIEFRRAHAKIRSGHCERDRECFVTADCDGDMGRCFLRRRDFFRFPPVGHPGSSTIDASLLWLRAVSDVDEDVRLALVLVIGMVIGVVVLIALVTFYDMCTSSITLASFFNTLAFVTGDKFSEDAKENQAQVTFWTDHGVADVLATPGSVDDAEFVRRILDRFEQVKEKFVRDESVQITEARDPVGASLMHWTTLQACLGNPAASIIAKKLAKALVNQRYDRPLARKPSGSAERKRSGMWFGGPRGQWQLGKYDGETSLHLAVVLNERNFTKELLDQGADPFARTFGGFFTPGREWTADDKAHTYFGEYSLSFAVGMGNQPIADILLKHAQIQGGPPKGSAASQRMLLRAQDSFGNTALHIAVLHRRTEMWDWIMSRLRSATSDMDPCEAEEEIRRATHIRGAQGLTPLGLATVLGHKDTFAHCLADMQKTEWQFGKVECCSINLDQIDTVALENVPEGKGCAAGPKEQHRSMLNLIFLYRVYSLATNSMIVRLMDVKWLRLAPFFYVSLVCHVLFLTGLVVLATEFIEVQQVSGNTTGRLLSCEVACASWCVVLVCVTAADIFGGLRDTRRQQRVMDAASSYRGQEVKFEGSGAQSSVLTFAGVPSAPAMPKDFHSGSSEVQDSKAWSDFWAKYVVRSDASFMPSAKSLMSIVPMSPWGFCSWAGQVFFLLHVIMFSSDGMAGNATPASSTLLALAILSYFVSMLQYTVAFRSLDSLVNIIWQCVVSDVRDFAVIYAFFLLGFGVALYLVLDHSAVTVHHQKATATQWENLGWGLDILIRRTMGDIGVDRNQWMGPRGKWPYVAYWLMLMWTILGLVILLNLLISMFSSTYEQTQQAAVEQWRVSKGRRIILIERRMRLLCDCVEPSLRINHAADPEKEHRFVFERDVGLRQEIPKPEPVQEEELDGMHAGCGRRPSYRRPSRESSGSFSR
eukprot:TRINITY_DN1008_c0_g1_i2.p1 TRINITY_DN1008_c0_g1~~TRINITY_DN1008_c0_g1_i2.p1  ORF type:complete len:1374 (+),score=412.60 TRINITY_DN1008_c0_g1_i2:269-4390(+)